MLAVGSVFVAGIAASLSMNIYPLWPSSYFPPSSALPTASLLGSLMAAAIGVLWVFLYLTSGAVSRVVRVSQKMIDWFNRTVDIENKPLQAIRLGSRWDAAI
jgi:hypothetical protein